MKKSEKELPDKAALLALEARHKGFHCSESVFLAINGTLDIIDPAMVRIVTGFHGGGGVHRKYPEVELNEALEKIALGRDRRPVEELPIEVYRPSLRCPCFWNCLHWFTVWET